MDNLRKTTIDTYNKSATELAEYFRGIGPRVKYIDKALTFAGNPSKPKVIEIGCGDGRDAKDIVTKSGNYTGFDISEALIELAKKHVPKVRFEVADAVDFNYPSKLDVVFAFASLLHSDKNEIKVILDKVHKSLRRGGIFYISLKWAAEYTDYVKKDIYGTRLFYLYNAELIANLAAEGYEVADTWRETIGHTEWFEIALRKI